MNIPDEYHKIILKEFYEIQDLCKKSSSSEDRLYFFSASFGVVNRVMNFYQDPVLIFTHQILQSVHQAISNRLANIKPPFAVSRGVPDQFWDALLGYFSELTHAFEIKNDEEIRKTLEKFANLWYANSGNGFYLYLKGLLVL